MLSPSPTATAKPHWIRLQPSKGWVSLKLSELWEYRELLYFLTWRDIKIRYKQTALGAAWAVIQPVFTMLVFSIFFGKLARMPSDGIPYPIFSFAALVPWTLFVYGLTQASNSLVGSSNLIRKVYFPRLVIPISSLFSGVVDFLIAFAILLGMMLYYGIHPTFNAIWLPMFVLLTLVTSLGIGLWLSALNVEYRDVKYVVEVLVTFAIFFTPVFYDVSMFGKWANVFLLNPLAPILEGFSACVIGGQMPQIKWILYSTAVSLATFAFAFVFFTKLEPLFAERI